MEKKKKTFFANLITWKIKIFSLKIEILHEAWFKKLIPTSSMAKDVYDKNWKIKIQKSSWYSTEECCIEMNLKQQYTYQRV